MVGHNSGRTITNSHASVRVYGLSDAGGLVGYNGTLENFYLTGVVDGGEFVGGGG